MNLPAKSKTSECSCAIDVQCGGCLVNLPSGVVFWLLEGIEDTDGPRYAVCQDCHSRLLRKALEQGKVVRT